MKLDDIDWSFPNLSNTGLHSFHWYPATYLSAIPGTLIPYLTKAGDTVLDPFCGSGTTGLETIRLGRRFIGLDTNPVAILITEAKLSFVSPKTIKAGLGKVVNDSSAIFGESTIPAHNNMPELLGWYHPETYETLNRLLFSILTLPRTPLRNTLLALFSSILKTCSSQGKHWGWVCDNVKPRTNEIIHKDALGIFSNAVIEFCRISDNSYRDSFTHTPNQTRKSIKSNYKLFQGDCVRKMATFEENSIDLISTSPPYYGVADYVKSQRLTYLWLDKDELENDNLGFRKFEQLRSLETGARSNRFRNDSHERYLNFMERYVEECTRILKSGAHMTMVVGESESRKGTISEIIEIASIAGLQLASRHGRDIKASRRRLMAKVKGEEVLIFRK